MFALAQLMLHIPNGHVYISHSKLPVNDAGQGLFAVHALAPNTPLGPIAAWDWRWRDFSEEALVLTALGDHSDGKFLRNVTGGRYINHSPDPPKGQANLRHEYTNGVVYVFTMRAVDAGDEFLIDYRALDKLLKDPGPRPYI